MAKTLVTFALETGHIVTDDYNRIAHLINSAWPGYKAEYVAPGNVQMELKEEQQSTFYCLFYPLGIYCAFGASNIHHAYNKAAKYWGAKKMDNPQELRTICHGELTQTYRLHVGQHEFKGLKKVSHTLMTKCVKAWREENV